MKWLYWIHVACGTLLTIAALIALSFLLDEVRYFPSDREGAFIVGFWFCTLSAAAIMSILNTHSSKTSRSARWQMTLNIGFLIFYMSMFINFLNDPVSALLLIICALSPLADLIRIGLTWRSRDC